MFNRTVDDAGAPASTRTFDASPDRVFRAHCDPELFGRWIGPDDTIAEIDHFDRRTGGRTLLTTTSLVDSFEARDAFVASGMEAGVQDGCRKLDAVLAET
ncbi:MAG: hypothetical protein S0880_18605 [Actinomycetota bacterium]|nr:hypothetical protein [Actinomycetota bacterium]